MKLVSNTFVLVVSTIGVAAAAQQLVACSNGKFSGCSATRTCPGPGTGGSAGEAGSGGSNSSNSLGSGNDSTTGSGGNPSSTATDGGSGGDSNASLSNSDGSSGAAGDNGTGGSGSGETGGPPPCEADDDCKDGDFCNGVEQCLEGTCQQGPHPCVNPDPEFCTIECDELADSCTVLLNGTEASGSACQDECATHNDNCDPNAICINEAAGFRCECPEGWIGDGLTCRAGVRSLTNDGAAHCAIKYDGTIWCWGFVEPGPFPEPTTTPTLVSSDAPWEWLSWSQTRCGILEGSLYCWGGNSSGQLGLGDTGGQPVETPTKVGTATDWQRVSVAGSSTCAIRDSALYCWGYTQGHIENDGYEQFYATPQRRSESTGWEAVELGGIWTCGIRLGEAYCWGSAFTATLGDGLTEQSVAPIRVSSLGGFTEISAGGNGHACAIRRGELYCWGDNFAGKLGDGTTGPRTTPLRIGAAADWETVSAGQQYTCGIRSGKAYCWGSNTSAQLGDGTKDERRSPTPVLTNLTWQAIDAGSATTCGISNYEVYCWGGGSGGQLGNGSLEESPTPVKVVFPE